MLLDIFKHLYNNSIQAFPTDKRVRKKEYYFADFAEWSFEIDLNTIPRYYIHSIRLVFITTLGVFMTNKTLDYYNTNSETFIQSTISADLKDMQNKQFMMPNTQKTAVEILWQLDTPVREDIYRYIVEE